VGKWNLNLDLVETKHMGSYKHITCGLGSMKIIANNQHNDILGKRIELVKLQVKDCNDEFNKTRLQERLGKLESGISVISVGAATEIEMRERKLRIEDAINAVRAATAEGIVPGGGIAYMSASKYIEQNTVGGRILAKSLESILRKILVNADEKPRIVIKKLKTSKNDNYGYNALDKNFGDMIESDIVDPAKVIKQVIRNATSAAATLLTTQGMIVNSFT